MGHTTLASRFLRSSLLRLSLASALALAAGCASDNNNGVDGGLSDGAAPDATGATGAVDGGADLFKGCGLTTCQSMNANCGLIGDGCGGTIDCGSCTAPETCGGGGTPFQCGGKAACVPTTCAQAGANCGPIADGCGSSLDCGTCPAGQACGVGGKPSVCASGSMGGDGGMMNCTPRTCALAGANCGPVADGCGGLLMCGSCTNAGETCGGGGTASVCGKPKCSPMTCAQLGFNCGVAGDGCGNLLTCGTMNGGCPTGQSCGGGGMPGVCGAPSCTPKTCAQLGFNCGAAGDGCGNLIAGGCGTCPTGQGCGAQGKPNVCQPLTAPDGGACTNLCMQQMACSGGGTTTVTGTVFAPTDASKGYGSPDPLPGALIYVPNGTVQPIGQNVSCGACSSDVTGDPLVTTMSNVNGTFTLTNVPCGNNIPLVIQLGRWRRHIVIPNVACCQTTQLTPDQSRFPRTQGEGNDPLNNIPLFAITTGSADAIECILPKIGIATSQFSNASGTGRVRFYHDNGATQVNGQGLTGASTLWNSPTELAKYDAVIFDCVGGEVNKTSQQLMNVQSYANAGGRIFASHFSYVWLYTNQPWGCGNQCTTPNKTTAAWNVSQPDPMDQNADIDQSFPKGKLFAQWLQTVKASATLGVIPVQNLRQDIDQTNPTPPNGIIPPGQQWMWAENDLNPLEYTFNTPTNVAAANQCGRVLYSDFHVYDAGGNSFPNECQVAPLSPQEKVLEFQIFDLTSCINNYVSMCKPATCAQLGFNCGMQGDGCGNAINCGTCPSGQVCGGGGKPGVCSGGCTPTTCAALGFNCGPQGDGCGGMLDCGTCPAGQVCGGGGAGKCGGGCTKTSCAAQGFSCGPAGDGCGGMLDCGTCPAGQVCGAQKPGVCGVVPDGGSCTARTCAQQNLNCGPAGDGCGNLIQCGTCPAGETCGGGGTPGVCGKPVCTPRTCTQANANCGVIGDGCGGTINCGTCPSTQTCGGGGVANQCGSIG